MIIVNMTAVIIVNIFVRYQVILLIVLHCTFKQIFPRKNTDLTQLINFVMKTRFLLFGKHNFF